MPLFTVLKPVRREAGLRIQCVRLLIGASLSQHKEGFNG